MIGDAVVDLYRHQNSMLQRVGALGNVVGCLDLNAADWVVVTAHPDSERVTVAMRWAGSSANLHIFSLESACENVVYYDVRGGVAECVRDEPKRGALAPKAVREIERLILDGGFETIVVADYNLGVMTPETQAAVRRCMIERGSRCFVDCRHANYESYWGGAYLMPNLTESNRLVDTSRAAEAVRALAKRFRAAGVFLKRGPDGLTVLLDSSVFDVPARKVVLADSSGAGDFLLAELASSAARGRLSRAAVEEAVERVEVRLSRVGGGLIRPMTSEPAQCDTPPETRPWIVR